jgi:hypothetical protein
MEGGRLWVYVRDDRPAEALQRIAELYAIETTIRGPDGRRTAERAPIQIAAAGHGDEGLARDPAHSHPAPRRSGRCDPLCLDPLERTLQLP